MNTIGILFDDNSTINLSISDFVNFNKTNPVSTAADIATNADSAHDKIADMDGDGDLDIISGSANDHTIAWYENDGQ